MVQVLHNVISILLVYLAFLLTIFDRLINFVSKVAISPESFLRPALSAFLTWSRIFIT
jgi:hypothetical protein